MDIFDLNKKDFEKLDTFFKRCPQYFGRATANVLTSLAFKTREYDIDEITQSMTVRNPAFLRSSLRVDKAKGGRIESQVAEVYSIKRDNFSGWQEQQKGEKSKKRYMPTNYARGGNKRSIVKRNMRFNNAKRTMVKPSQFPGRDQKSQFYAMLRIMATRKGGYFYLDNPVVTKSSKLPKGLYRFAKNKMNRISEPGDPTSHRNKWRTRSVNRVVNNKNLIGDIWSKSLDHIIQQSGLSHK